MIGKPFRSPLLSTHQGSKSAGHDEAEPQAKKRRIEQVNSGSKEQSGSRLIFKKPGISLLPRKPLSVVGNLPAGGQAYSQFDGLVHGYYNVLWYAR